MELSNGVIAFFMFVLGCCIGSFLNSLIWRLPLAGRRITFRGRTGPLTLHWPPSHCPHCHAAVRWQHNIPVWSWLALRGRCADCPNPISIRYPLVELGTGLTFLGLYLAYFVTGWYGTAFAFPERGFVTLIVDLFMCGGLLAISAIDADWFEIPLVIPGLMALVALGSIFWGLQPRLPSLATTSYLGRFAAKFTIGGTVGSLVSIFWIYWRSPAPACGEQTALTSPPASGAGTDAAEVPTPRVHGRVGVILGITVLLVLLLIASWIFLSGKTASLFTLIAGLLLFLLGVLPTSGPPVETLAEAVFEETAVPSARLEMLKESLLLLPPLVLALAAMAAPIPLPAAEWCQRLFGVVLGALLGGGIVWCARIGGTLAFGRVAMGMGDIYLMAAIGAVLGWPMVWIVFFLAPFLALAWAAVWKLMGRSNVLPYGPWLSVAAILILLLGPPITHWYRLQLFPPAPPHAAPLLAPPAGGSGG